MANESPMSNCANNGAQPESPPAVVSELKPAGYNPRRIGEAELARLGKSLERFGDLGGIVFNRRTGNLVGGHQRVKKFGPESEIVLEREYQAPTRAGTVAEGYVLCYGERFAYREVDWSIADEKTANIAANQHGGEFVNEKLGPITVELAGLQIDLDLLGFERTELDPLLATEWPGLQTSAGPTSGPGGEPSQDKAGGATGGASGSDAKPQMAEPIPLTVEQRQVVEQACAKLRTDENDLLISTGRCLELICADFLAG